MNGEQTAFLPPDDDLRDEVAELKTLVLELKAQNEALALNGNGAKRKRGGGHEVESTYFYAHRYFDQQFGENYIFRAHNSEIKTLLGLDKAWTIELNLGEGEGGKKRAETLNRRLSVLFEYVEAALAEPSAAQT